MNKLKPVLPELQRLRLTQAGLIAERLVAVFNSNDWQTLNDPAISALAEKVIALSADDEITPFIGDDKPKDVSEIEVGYLYDNLGLPMKLYNTLWRRDLHTVGAIQAKSAEELLAYPNIGENSVSTLRRILGQLGVSLRDE